MLRGAGIVGPMNPGDKAALFHELSQLVRSGTPFSKAIDQLARLSGGITRVALLRIRTALNAGGSVGDALLAGAPLVSPLEACTLRASDRAGRLDFGLEQASQYHAAIAASRARIRSRLAYPFFVLHFALLILPLPLAFAANGGLFAFLTAAAFGIGAFWLTIFLIAALARMLVAWADRCPSPDRILRSLPLFGGLRRDFALGRFCAAYHMQLSAGVNALASLEASGAASGSAVLREAAARAMHEVRTGSQVGAALAATDAFPAKFLRAFAVGEQTGSLDADLQRCGDEYRGSAMRRLGTLAEWLPRIFYLGILIYIAWRVIGMYALRLRDLEKVMEG